MSILAQLLGNYSLLDLTHDVDRENRFPIGGGGYSDVFRAQMRPGWNVSLGSNKIIEEILAETRCLSPELPLGRVRVAVKRLRIWGKPIPTVEKVIHETKK